VIASAPVKPRSLLAASTLCCVLSMAASSHAQSSGTATDEIARSHAENGGRYFHLGRYADAAREFQAAYELSLRPELLFNLARALENAGRDREALDAYERFEAVGSPGIDPSNLRARIEALRTRLQTTAPIAPIVTRRTPAPITPTPAPAPLVERPAVSRGLALPVTLLGAGGALLLTGLALGLTVSSTYSDLQARCTNRVCDPSLQGDADAASTRAVIGDVLGGAGLAAIAAGVVVLLLPRSSSDARSPRVGFACTGAGCAGRVAITF
jgi:tetratricopeptide (TPR) repeat protein